MRNRLLIGAAACLFAGVAVGRIPAEVPVGKNARSETRSVTILASPSIVPVGSACRVETIKKRSKGRDGIESDGRMIYTGRVLSGTDAEIVIKATEAEHVVTPVVPAEFAEDPDAERLFKTSGVTRRYPEGKETAVATGDIRSITVTSLPPRQER